MGLGEKDTFLFPIFPPGDENHPGLTRLWEEAWQAQQYHQEAGLSLQSRGWCTGMTQREGMGREVGGGLRMAILQLFCKAAVI